MATGLVSGTPTAAGPFSYTILVTDADGAMASQPLSGTIAGLLTLASTPSDFTEVGVAYSQSNTASGGTTPYVYSISAGALPVGTALNSTTGLVSGTPTTAGPFSYTILVTDAEGAMASQPLSGTIAGLLTLASTPSDLTEVGVAYSQSNVASGGTTPYVYSISAGSVPAGTGLNTSTGLVSGTPTTAGPFSYTILVTDADGAMASQPLSGTIAGLLTLASTPSDFTEVGVAYSQSNTASGGTTPYVYSISAGALPVGTALNSTTGLVSGTPTTAGPFSYTILVTDADGAMATQPLSGTIAGLLTLASTPSDFTEVGVAYSQSNIASGGTTPYVYSVSAGSVPAGTSLNTATGLVSGTPTTAGPFSYTILVTDADGAMATQPLTGTIAGLLTLASTPSQFTEVGLTYSQSNIASGGTTPYVYSVSAGSVPAGTSLNATTGLVLGFASTAGPFSYTITVTDADGATASQTLSGTIAGSINLVSTPSEFTEVDVSYSQTNVASGGTPPYAFIVSAGALPDGTALDPATGLVSGVPTTAGSFTYTIFVEDADFLGTSNPVSGTIAPVLDLTSTPSANTVVGEFYSQSNVASGGTPPYTYANTLGALPAGTTLDTSTGLVSGTLTAPGSFGYTIFVTDSGGGAISDVNSGTITP